MTLQEFVAKWNGRPIDFDEAYGFQCMDLMHQYCLEVLGITDRSVLAAPIARSVYENFDNIKGHELFDKIPQTLTGIPKDGDIIFWKQPYGYYYNTVTKRWEYAGHVGISLGSNLWNVTAFEQNNPGGTYCHVQKHTDLYRGVLGWLHPKGIGTGYSDRQALVDIKGYEYSQSDDSTVRQRVKEVLSKVGV